MTKTSDRNKRELDLFKLLIERALDEEGCDVRLQGEDWIDVRPCTYNTERDTYVLRFDIDKNMPGTVTDHWWGAGHQDVSDLWEEAVRIAQTIDHFQRERREIKVMLSEVGAAVRREVAKAARRMVPLRIVSISVAPVEAGRRELPYVQVQLELLGASLLPGIVTLEFGEGAEVKEAFAGFMEDQQARRMRQIILQAAGADGEIDLVALRYMQSRGCDVPAVLSRLPRADHGILDVFFEDGTGDRLVLFWKDGLVNANFRLTENVCWSEGRVAFKDAPKKFPAKPYGQRLSDFVKHEAIPDDLLIYGGHKVGGSASAWVPIRTMQFNSETGEAWAA